MSKRGFTILELLIVVLIVAVLATIAMPSFLVSRQRALDNEAKATLKLIAAAEGVYRTENPESFYRDCLCSSIAECNGASGCNTRLGLDVVPNPAQWTYNVAYNGDNKTFVATATYNSGKYSGCVYESTELISPRRRTGTNCLQ